MLLLGSIFYSYRLQACGNELPETLLKIPALNPKNEAFGPLLTITQYTKNELHALRNFYAERESEGLSIESKVNYALTLMRLGDPGTAKVMLADLSQDTSIADSTHRYAIAANLGTAYELLGNNDSALLWIRRAVAINANSHQGSEWIHVMLLRYKVSKEKNPGYLTEAGALNLDFGQLDLPQNTYNMNLEELQNQLGWQLQERLFFIPAPDTLMGMLLFDYANMVALQESLEAAKFYYEQAQVYGFSSDLLKARLNRITAMNPEDLQKKAGDFQAEALPEPPAQWNVYAIAGVLALLAVLVVYFLLQRKKNS